MSLKSLAASYFASYINRKLDKDAQNAVNIQRNLLMELVQKAEKTAYGEDHNFSAIVDYESFKKATEIRDYEALKPYVDRILDGQADVVWPEKPIYFAKTSGTTSGAKFIPITADSISNHINSARNMLLRYLHQKGNARLVDGKMIFLSGSPELGQTAGIKTGRLSGIVNHHVPSYLTKSRLPSYKTNVIDDWEDKLDNIVKETINSDMRVISGIPPWIQMYFDLLIERSGKKVGELFPNLSLVVHGGVNFSPYRAKLEESLGREIDFLETFPASEGFFAFQDDYRKEGLYLNVNSGIFFEFVPLDEFFDENPRRLMLGEVQIGQNYVMIISSNAGLWAYNIGDTIEFLSVDPYLIKVTGRVKHYISAFGEHVIASEVSDALSESCAEYSCNVKEFTVAPQVNPKEGLPHHDWFVEFETAPSELTAFAQDLDQRLCLKNSYYADLIRGHILRPLVIQQMKKGAFQRYMKSIGKLGGQNKVPKLSNDRRIADALAEEVI